MVLGKTQKIVTINIYNHRFRYNWTGNVSDAANYVKIYVDEKLVAEVIQQAGEKINGILIILKVDTLPIKHS